MTIVNLMTSYRLPRNQCSTQGVVMTTLLVSEACLFGLFTLCMMCDQYSVLSSGVSHIDRFKGETSAGFGLQEVFGGANKSFSFDWLLPIEIWFPSSIQAQLLGYILETDLPEVEPLHDPGDSDRSFLLQNMDYSNSHEPDKNVLEKRIFHIPKEQHTIQTV